MKDEIKEILEFDFQSQGERIEINEYERDILKDYITNLQEKYDKALTDLVHESHTRIKLERKITNSQKRKITKEDVDKYFEENMCVSFDKFLENWNEQKEWADYFQERNKKAIKYIDDEIKKIRSHQYATGIRRINKIKNILQGENKE